MSSSKCCRTPTRHGPTAPRSRTASLGEVVNVFFSSFKKSNWALPLFSTLVWQGEIKLAGDNLKPQIKWSDDLLLIIEQDEQTKITNDLWSDYWLKWYNWKTGEKRAAEIRTNPTSENNSSSKIKVVKIKRNAKICRVLMRTGAGWIWLVMEFKSAFEADANKFHFLSYWKPWKPERLSWNQKQ